MATTSPTAPQVLETYALLQIAAEAFLGREPGDPAAPPTGMAVKLDAEMLIRGNDHSSKMTTAQAAKFVSEWKVLSHQPNTATGFSATLFESQVYDPARDLYQGKLVISIRSTEFIEDSARDSKATNELEIRETGWAFGQIADMETWWNSLPAWVRDGGKVDVTGYSLGGHLATAFFELHKDKVERAYTFNGAGVGQVTTGTLAQAVGVFSTRRAEGSNADLFLDPTIKSLYLSLVDKFNQSSDVTAAKLTAERIAVVCQGASGPGLASGCVRASASGSGLASCHRAWAPPPGLASCPHAA